MITGRKENLAMAIDLRLTDLWSELFELEPDKLDTELLGWFLRAAVRSGLHGRAARDPARPAVPRPRLLGTRYRVTMPAANR